MMMVNAKLFSVSFYLFHDKRPMPNYKWLISNHNERCTMTQNSNLNMYKYRVIAKVFLTLYRRVVDREQSKITKPILKIRNS